MKLLEDISLMQVVLSPARFSAYYQTSSTLALFATNCPDLIRNVAIGDTIPGHSCVNVKVSAQSPPRAKTVFSSKLDLEHAGWVRVLRNLGTAPLLSAFQGPSDVNVAWNTWCMMISNIIPRFVPNRSYVIGTKKNFWVTTKL